MPKNLYDPWKKENPIENVKHANDLLRARFERIIATEVTHGVKKISNSDLFNGDKTQNLPSHKQTLDQLSVLMKLKEKHKNETRSSPEEQERFKQLELSIALHKAILEAIKSRAEIFSADNKDERKKNIDALRVGPLRDIKRHQDEYNFLKSQGTEGGDLGKHELSEINKAKRRMEESVGILEDLYKASDRVLKEGQKLDFAPTDAEKKIVEEFRASRMMRFSPDKADVPAAPAAGASAAPAVAASPPAASAAPAVVPAAAAGAGVAPAVATSAAAPAPAAGAIPDAPPLVVPVVPAASAPAAGTGAAPAVAASPAAAPAAPAGKGAAPAVAPAAAAVVPPVAPAPAASAIPTAPPLAPAAGAIPDAPPLVVPAASAPAVGTGAAPAVAASPAAAPAAPAGKGAAPAVAPAAAAVVPPVAPAPAPAASAIPTAPPLAATTPAPAAPITLTAAVKPADLTKKAKPPKDTTTFVVDPAKPDTDYVVDAAAAAAAQPRAKVATPEQKEEAEKKEKDEGAEGPKSEGEAGKTIGTEAARKKISIPGKITWKQLFKEIGKLFELIGEIGGMLKDYFNMRMDKKREEEAKKLKEDLDKAQANAEKLKGDADLSFEAAGKVEDDIELEMNQEPKPEDDIELEANQEDAKEKADRGKIIAPDELRDALAAQREKLDEQLKEAQKLKEAIAQQKAEQKLKEEEAKQKADQKREEELKKQADLGKDAAPETDLSKTAAPAAPPLVEKPKDVATEKPKDAAAEPKPKEKSGQSSLEKDTKTQLQQLTDEKSNLEKQRTILQKSNPEGAKIIEERVKNVDQGIDKLRELLTSKQLVKSPSGDPIMPTPATPDKAKPKGNVLTIAEHLEKAEQAKNKGNETGISMAPNPKQSKESPDLVTMLHDAEQKAAKAKAAELEAQRLNEEREREATAKVAAAEAASKPPPTASQDAATPTDAPHPKPGSR